MGHFHHSYVAQSALEVKQARLELPPHKLVQDVCTRWNSMAEMITRLLEQHSAVSAVFMESKKKTHHELVLTATDITSLENIASLLSLLLKPLSWSQERGV